ncbi:MAG: hypothetical protein FJY76_02130 [Candidatus Aenigmarchaeota archaeon]|nr:hypothetical protein [Candidatus Aenigmarchaeota archaeon]
MDGYFDEAKRVLEEKIPEFDTPEFRRMRDEIRKKLTDKEADLLITVRRLKILVLGDWFTAEKKQLLSDIKNNLLKNGLYAETIDRYYDMNKSGGLSQLQILETCCINHQLIVFIDGEGKGTLTEQNYLCSNYVLHGKILFLIDEAKFDKFKDNPSEYIRDFPTIITYKGDELTNKVVTYSKLRIYRLANIIKKQESAGAGLRSPNYEPWKERLKGKKGYKP